MKTLLAVVAIVNLFLLSCQPEPLPDLRDQMIGEWRLSITGNAYYSSIFSYNFNHDRLRVRFEADGSAIFEGDSVYTTSWSQQGRDIIIMNIPASMLLPELGEWEGYFVKETNYVKQQYWRGSGTYVSDTAAVDNIYLSLTLDMDRIP